MLNGLKKQVAALLETFDRFQAGFLSSEDFHRFQSICMVFYRFPWILIDFHVFRGMDAKVSHEKRETCETFDL